MSTPPAVRPSLADAIRETFTPEYLKELAESVKEMSKGTFAFCPNCREKVQVSVPDLPRVIGAVKDLLEQSEGKPGTASPEEAGVVLIVERTWPPPRDPDEPDEPEAA